jgi:hypothetical protein
MNTSKKIIFFFSLCDNFYTFSSLGNITGETGGQYLTAVTQKDPVDQGLIAVSG